VAVVTLRGPLRKLAGDRAQHPVAGGTIAELLRELERCEPALGGWILDERGILRRHINVFVNGERALPDTPVGEDDRVDVLPAISGGSQMTELLVGTKKGLFVLEGEPGAPFEVKTRAFAGLPVEYAMREPSSGRYLAGVSNPFYGPKIWHADDPAGEWEQAEGPTLPEGGDAALKRIWTIVPGEAEDLMYAGGDPGVLFESRDGGSTWTLNEPLWEEPSRPEWNPGAGGMCLHSIATWPGDPQRLAIGISARGVWLTEDGGESWRQGIEGLVPRYVPEESREGSKDLCVHNLHRATKQPDRLFMQFHGGVYRSDDAGATWVDIGTDNGLPSDFGFPLVIDPDDPSSAYVIPLVADMDRVTPDGRVRVYETRDAGESWAPHGDGLPAEDAYLTILRQAFDREGSGSTMGLYFGATSGDVFGSGDAGATWSTAATHLPPVHSVRVA
jgi:photosystem II stability/assembly factor-like uncharacterized protein/molybdopterin converting factor small subunit